MRIIFVQFVTVILSVFLLSFGAWTYAQSLYHDNVRKFVSEKAETKIENLKEAQLLSDKFVLLKGIISNSETFKGKNNSNVILERYAEEKKDKGSRKDWKLIKENSYFKIIPFKLYNKEKTSYVLVDSYDVDKTFLGKSETKEEEKDNVLFQKSLWQFKNEEEVYVIGKLENKSGQLIITNPNLNKSIYSGDFLKEPFIITKYKPQELAEKSKTIGLSIFYSSIALVFISAFVFISSIFNIIKKTRAGTF